MEEVRQLVAEEGREARNLVAFHVAVDSPVAARISRKPPRSASTIQSLRRPEPGRTPTRLRSASAGRDKRAELQARYWALLFGNLQRAIGEIYTTVEAHENLSECQEVILVLENYTRDFKSLCEWFRLKWEYDNTPPPQRPQSLAWEVRKTDFGRPDSRRAHSVKSSPSVSGKNSPCLSGHNTPSGKNSPSLSTGKASPGGSGKISPRITGSSITSPKSNVEFFGSKSSGAAKIHSKTESKPLKDTSSRLSDIKEKVATDTGKTCTESDEDKKPPKTESPSKSDLLVVEMGTAKEYPSVVSPKQVVIKTPPKNTKAAKVPEKQFTSQPKDKVKDVSPGQDKNQFMNENNLEDIVGKARPTVVEMETGVIEKTESNVIVIKELDLKNSAEEETAAERKILKPIDGALVNTLNDKENNLNVANAVVYSKEGIISGDQKAIIEDCSETIEADKEPNLMENVNSIKNVSPKSPQEKKPDTKSPINEPKTVITKAAYSQAAAKPKTTSTKPEVKPLAPKAVSLLTRSKTVVEIQSNAKTGNRHVQPKRPANNRCSYPFNLTTGRPSLFDGTPNSNARTNNRNINRTNVKVASGDRLSKNDEINKRVHSKRPDSLKIEDAPTNIQKINPNLEKIKDSGNSSSTDTIVTQIDRNESSESLKTLVPELGYQLFDELFANSIEVLNVDNKAENDNDGWLTVKSRRLSRESKKQSKSHWAKRFDQPSATTSLPTLNMIESPKQEHKPITCKSETKESCNQSSAEAEAHNKKKLENDLKNSEDEPEILKNAEESEVALKQTNAEESDKNTATADENNKNPNEQPPKDIKKEENNGLESKEKAKSARKMPKVNVLEIKKPENKSLKVISTAIVRQKSDVTGLKTRSSRNKSVVKVNKNDKKVKPVETTMSRSRLHSSLESLIPSGLSRSQESTEPAYDFDRWKFEFKNSIDFLEDEDRLLKRSEFLKTADPVEMSEIALMTCEIEENERKISLALDFQSDVDQMKLCEEEDLLNRQIEELQQVSDIEFDTETDDTETDAEILCEDAQHLDAVRCSMEGLGPLAASLEDQYEPVLAGLSWAERVDTLATLEALVARYPGRAQQLHAKLSQGIRRRGSLQETLKRYQWKQARAEHQRLELQTERTSRIHQLLARVEDVKAAKNQLIDEKRQRMEQRLQKAAENRDQHLKDIVRKAHDEEEKLREIAFIKQLEAEHRRQDFLEQCRSHTARLRQMRRDRLLKLEQKAAREAAVGARRQALEEARAQHVCSLLERRRQRDARVVELRERTRLTRHSVARQKAADVKSRLTALAAAADADAAALRSRIRTKQDATQERHAEHLRAIRTRALQPARPHTTSESQDTKPDEEQVSDMEPEMSKEKLKATRKKARKLKHKLLAAGQQYESSTKMPPITALMMKNKMCRALSQLQSILAAVTMETDTNGTHEPTPEPDDKKKRKRRKHSKSFEDERDTSRMMSETERHRKSSKNSICSSTSDLSRQSRNEVSVGAVLNTSQLDRCLNELYRIMEKVDQNAPERTLLGQVNGLRPLCRVLAIAAEQDQNSSDDTLVQNKSVITCCNTLLAAVHGGSASCQQLCADLLHSTGSLRACQLSLQAVENADLPLMKCLADLQSTLFESVKARGAKVSQEISPEELVALRQRAFQLISYGAVSGICSEDCGDELYRLLTVSVQLCEPLDCDGACAGDRQAAWTALRAALRPRLAGARAHLSSLSVSPQLPPLAECARLAALLRAVAERDRALLQESFGSGGHALEFSAAVARLLAAHAPPVDKDAPAQHNKHNKSQQNQQTEQATARQAERLVLDLIVLVGYFVVDNEQNQRATCGGSGGGGVVRALCSLPAGWLCEPHCSALLPTLAALAAHPHARERIAADMSLQMIEEYLSSPEAKNIRLVQLIHEGRAKQRGTNK